MDDRHARAAASRDGHLALRRVERQQQLVEILSRSKGAHPARVLADRLGVSVRTVERDVERLRDAGVPFTSWRGRTGGMQLTVLPAPAPVELDVAEIAAIIAGLATVGPNSSPSASSANAKLVSALHPDQG